MSDIVEYEVEGVLVWAPIDSVPRGVQIENEKAENSSDLDPSYYSNLLGNLLTKSMDAS